MELTWREEEGDVAEKLKIETVDVFVEACGNIGKAAEAALTAIENHAHVVLTDARVDVAVGLLLQHEAYQQGIIVTSDAGTPHGTLATMIQEAHIMGLKPVQAGQSISGTPFLLLPYEMAALANGFDFLPPDGGMTGPEVSSIEEALNAFDLESYGDTPRVDFLRTTKPSRGLYLIVKAAEEQAGHLRACQLGEGPYYLIRRDHFLGHLETPKAILGAAAGQAILSPGYPACDVYAKAVHDLDEGTSLEADDFQASLEPLDDDRIPLSLLEEGAVLKKLLTEGEYPTFDDLELPDSNLLRLWLRQRELL
jgi:predicted homoserine dehydrogenase-like protein